MASCATKDGVVARRHDIGHGFKSIEKEFSYAGSGVDHFMYLYYLKRELGKSTRYSISPSGKFAAYQMDSTSEVMIFEVARDQARVLLPGRQRMIRKFEWLDSEMNVRIIFREGDAIDVRTSAAVPTP